LFSEIHLGELEIPRSRARVLKHRDCIFVTQIAEENNLGKVQKLKQHEHSFPPHPLGFSGFCLFKIIISKEKTLHKKAQAEKTQFPLSLWCFC